MACVRYVTSRRLDVGFTRHFLAARHELFQGVAGIQHVGPLCRALFRSAGKPAGISRIPIIGQLLMTHERPTAARNFEPDPFDVQIGAMVIFHRAALLDHGAVVYDQLIQISNDSIWYGQLLAEQHAQKPPWDAGSNNEVTPPELFLDTAALVGHVQCILKPSLGMARRHFRLITRAQAEQGRFGPTPKVARSLAVAEVIQHPDNRWQILHAEVRADHRRQGIATILCDRIEAILETRLRPSGWLSEDAYKFWMARGCPFLKSYRQIDHLPRLWLSPKTLLTLRAIAETKLMMAETGGDKPN